MKKHLILLLLSLVILSCNQEPSENFKDNINAYVNNLPSVKQRAPFPERLVGSSGKTSLSATDEYEIATQLSDHSLYSPANEIFYPGALCTASSVVDGDYKPITVNRADLTVSTSLNGPNTSVTTVIKSPKLSTTRSALNDLISGQTFNVPEANLKYSVEEVHSDTQASIAISAGYEGLSTSVQGSLNFNYRDTKSKVVVKFAQIYYTVDVDIPQKPSDFFVDDFDYTSLFAGNKPLYVSSVSYGRIYLMTIESSMSSNDLKLAIQGTFLGGAATAQAEANFSAITATSTVKASIIGGNSSVAGLTVGDLSSLRTFIANGASFDGQNPGAAISYRLRELGTNDEFKTVLYAKYGRLPRTTNAGGHMDYFYRLHYGHVKDLNGNLVSMPRLFITRRRTDANGVTATTSTEYHFDYWTGLIELTFNFIGNTDEITVDIRNSNNTPIDKFTLPNYAVIYAAYIRAGSNSELFPYPAGYRTVSQNGNIIMSSSITAVRTY